MFNRNISFKNFKSKKPNINKKKKLSQIFTQFLKEDSEILKSMKKDYKDSFSNKLVSKLKSFSKITIIGMGGSVLGAKAIYNFIRPRKKKFIFIDSFQNFEKHSNSLGKNLNLIISKSGNTLETISNANVILNKKHKKIFITENKKSYLMDLANKLKAEVISHNNFIGGRYSVFSEVGMLPAELMGLKSKKFRKFDQLIKNKKFVNSLILNVSSILSLMKKDNFNSIILNYDEKSEDLFKWYQQLIGESLGKKNKGILPLVSSMPKDNHSLMQHYLDGVKNNFFTFFFVKEKSPSKINFKEILKSHYYLKNKNLNDISYSQFKATENVFKRKKIPFRSFTIKKRDEETLGELFSFFIFETILLGKAMNINPYNQPSVELIKLETKKILKKF